ncbi:MAG: rRNA maturation RNase YbeY [Chloroflexi bacterium]|nr:rRNA maturation RNase YbeY [Chloroflexota bacterium]
MEINVLFDDGLDGVLETDWLENVAEKVLVAQGVSPEAELGLVIVGQEKVRRLNLNYLGKDEPTDVLSFAMLPESADRDPASFVVAPDGIQHLGEVIISYPQAVLQAEEHRHSVKKEVAILIVHGVLHLLGYDHERPEDKQKMRAREAEMLNDIGGDLN